MATDDLYPEASFRRKLYRWASTHDSLDKASCEDLMLFIRAYPAGRSLELSGLPRQELLRIAARLDDGYEGD